MHVSYCIAAFRTGDFLDARLTHYKNIFTLSELSSIQLRHSEKERVALKIGSL